jgi:hypothetical protein
MQIETLWVSLSREDRVLPRTLGGHRQTSTTPEDQWPETVIAAQIV